MNLRKRLARRILNLALRLDNNCARKHLKYSYKDVVEVDGVYKGVRAGFALQKLIESFDFNTIIDVGAGAGEHSEILGSFGKDVTSLDKGGSVYFQNRNQCEFLVADITEVEFGNQFDALWCCHVLEHQLEPFAFLQALVSCVKDDGVICITVPPPKREVVSGHVTYWSAGLLLYWLVLSGVDCSSAKVLSSGYNISVIVQKKLIKSLPELAMDSGDLSKLKGYFPSSLEISNNNKNDFSFCGEIVRLNW